MHYVWFTAVSTFLICACSQMLRSSKAHLASRSGERKTRVRLGSKSGPEPNLEYLPSAGRHWSHCRKRSGRGIWIRISGSEPLWEHVSQRAGAGDNLKPLPDLKCCAVGGQFLTPPVAWSEVCFYWSACFVLLKGGRASFFSLAINTTLHILSPPSLIHSGFFFLPRSYSSGAFFFSSAEVLFVLYPLQSSEYFCMNISSHT